MKGEMRGSEGPKTKEMPADTFENISAMRLGERVSLTGTLVMRGEENDEKRRGKRRGEERMEVIKCEDPYYRRQQLLRIGGDEVQTPSGVDTKRRRTKQKRFIRRVESHTYQHTHTRTHTQHLSRSLLPLYIGGYAASPAPPPHRGSATAKQML